MRKRWKESVIAVGAAAFLVLAGVAVAKPHDGSHGHGGGDHGRGGGPHGPGGPACDPAAVAGVAAAVDAACPCAGRDDGAGGTTPWKNHGQYVRCVAHATRDQLRTAGLKRRCVRGTVPCAAQSTCGKGAAVACVVTATGTCVNAACSNDPETTCAVDDDCTIRTCAVTTADRCAGAGGVAGVGSCCAASPSGAVLDPSDAF